MATQKKHHDLVILDRESTGGKQANTKKIISGVLFFLIGIFIGAFLISILNQNNNDFGLTSTNPTLTQSTGADEISPITTELQSITSITPDTKEGGCGIESLGRNNPEGCSADAFTEIPSEATDINSTDITDLNFLDNDKKQANDNISETGVTNILNLQ